MAFPHRIKGRRNLANIQGRKSKKNEGFKVGMNLLCPKNSRKASMAGGECARVAVVGDEMQDVVSRSHRALQTLGRNLDFILSVMWILWRV